MTGSILLVEDNDDLRESLTTLLQDQGFTVFGARNGREALDLLAARLAPCLILLDLMMPILSGWQFLEIRARNPELSNIPVVVVSASANPSTLPTGTRILRKPVDLDTFLDTVREYCG